MKHSQILMLYGFCFWGFFQIVATSNPFGKENPAYNVNLAPFIQRLSAYYCLQNISSDCPGNFQLEVDGWLNISASETQAFCGGGCAQHTQDVLKCVQLVKHDYTFENKATISDLNETINFGCTHGFNGTSFHHSHGTSTTTSLVATLSSLAFLALFYM